MPTNTLLTPRIAAVAIAIASILGTPFIAASEEQLSEQIRTYDNGQVGRIDQFVDGERHGTSKLYSENGQLIRQLEFVRGQRHGTLKEWDTDGNLTRQASYAEGQLHGKDERFFASGETRFIAQYTHGVPVGSQQTFSAPGQLSTEQVFNDNGERISEHRYGEEGQLIYANIPATTPHGSGREIRQFHADGSLSSVRSESDDGAWQLRRSFNDEGKLVERLERLNGRPVGDFVRRGWGRGLQYGSYKNGQLHGAYYTTTDQGEVLTEGQYDEGTQVGRWVEQDDYQRVISHYNTDGELDGVREQYDANGDLILREHYRDGVLDGNYVRYRNGQLIAQGEFIDGKREGPWINAVFYQGGLVQHGQYHADKQIGRWNVYNEHGHRVAIHQFNDAGQQHGRQLEFEANGALSVLKEFQNGLEHGVRVYYEYGYEIRRVLYEAGYRAHSLD